MAPLPGLDSLIRERASLATPTLPASVERAPWALATRPQARRLALLLVALLVVAGFGLPVLLREPAPIDNDAAQYLSLALDASRGLGFTYEGIRSQPLYAGWRWYPLLFSAVWLVSGVSLATTAWASKLALIGCALALLWLGWRLSGAAAALIAAALLLALPQSADLALRLEVDVAQTALLLAFLAAFQRGATRPSWGWFLAAGLLLGVGQRLRESALVWLPLPLLLAALVPGWRSRRVFLGAALALAATLVVVAPKLLYDALVEDPSWVEGMDAASSARVLAAFVAPPLVALSCAWLAPRLAGRGARVFAALALVGLALAGAAALALLLMTFGLREVPAPGAVVAQLGRYWDDRLGEKVPLWPALAPAWALVAVRALRGSPSDRVLLLAALAYLPVPLAAALVHWDPRYFLPLQALSALALGAGLVWLGRAALARAGVAPRGQEWGAALGLALGLALAGGMLARAPDPEVDRDLRAYDDLTALAAAWLRDHAPPGSRVMAHYRQASWLRFSGGATFSVWPLPIERPLAARELVDLARQGRVWLHITSYQDGGVSSTYAALGNQSLLEALWSTQARYLVLSGGYGPTSLAFEEALQPPAFREVFRERVRTREVRQEIVIYEVDRNQLRPMSFPVVMTPGTLRHLAEDLGTAPGGGLELLATHGVRLDLKSRGTLDLAPGWDPANPRSVPGWLARQESE